MAEIKIEEKKTIWPWILLGILLLGLLLYFVLRDNNDANTAAQTMQNTTSQAAMQDTNTTAGNNAAYNNDNYNSGSVEDYVSYINGTQAMGLDHNFTNGALLRLANAIQAKSQAVGYNVQTDIDRVKELANRITQDPMVTTHANSIREAAGILSSAMNNMQQAKFPNLNNEAQEVKSAATNIDPEVQTLEQKEEVKGFLDKSGNLLQKMS